jgi:microcystin-dependent protein
MKNSIKIFCCIALCSLTNFGSTELKAQNCTIGEVSTFAGNFAPRGWALCNGQILAISSNPALFSILGSYYGGDGRTTFALPDLRGRAIVHAGSGPGLSPKRLPQRSGTETASASGSGDFQTDGTGTKSGANNMQPFTAINYIICVRGIYPSRN